VSESPPLQPASGWRRIIPRLLVAAGVIAAGLYLSRNVLLGTPVPVHEAVRSDIVQTIVASGRVITPQRVTVGAVVTGRVSRIPVNEGQKVVQDELLIALDDRDEQATVAQARAAIVQAEARLRQVRELALPAANQSVLQAEASLQQLRRQYERIKTLRAQGFVGQAQLDEAQRNLDVATSQVQTARLQVETSSPGGSDHALAQAALASARAGLQAALSRLEHTLIRAPAAGVLIARSVEPGNIVQPGRELMVLAPAGETQLVLNIDERNLAQLVVGQRALASADAYPNQRFAAELAYINPGVDRQRGSVEVKLRVPDPPAYLRQDMTTSVDIEVARKSAVVVLPTDAVRDITGAAPWVLAVTTKRAVRRPVAIGLRGDGLVEITKGVAPGDLVIPATGSAATAGQRVRPHAAARGNGR